MADRYTKVVLTVIAAALVWLCFDGTMPVVQASAKQTPKKTVRQKTFVEPGIRGVVILGVATTADIDVFRRTGELPYTTTRGGVLPVSIKGMNEVQVSNILPLQVQIENTPLPVEVSEPLQVEASEPLQVNVQDAVEVEGKHGGFPHPVQVEIVR